MNPGRESVMGLKAYKSVRDIPGPVDLAVFTIPAAQVPGVMDDCAAKGVKAALVISAGFKELGGDGAELEMEMVRRARAGGIVLAGPNGQGVCNPGLRLLSLDAPLLSRRLAGSPSSPRAATSSTCW